ncbi:type IV pilus biogenesis/stability protein PilW [Azohydromonas sediminis]|uniref:type IV pilus biogenesis/stability protein PilW n=1 Tax=Azohydromonas sediminis TaxID=2259674 RepID=UPI000E656960|nr:type IV pilus biogenesis/stability protein PilW [Azohydromonas sediminis]
MPAIACPQPTRRARAAAAWAALTIAALAAGLGAGCATTDGAGGASEVRTASDLTDAERRARVRVELASNYFARGQTETALDEIKQALAAKPDFADAFNLRGLVYASLGDMRLAEESFRRALELAPRDGETMHNWAWVMCQQRRYAEADAMFARALELPNYRGVTRTLLARGVCQAREGRYELAERTLARSYELDPSNPATGFNLAEVLLRLGQYERARFYIGRVNAVPEQVNAQTLWLAARIEHKLGNATGVADYGRQLRGRFPQSPEAAALESRRFDD